MLYFLSLSPDYVFNFSSTIYLCKSEKTGVQIKCGTGAYKCPYTKKVKQRHCREVG